MAYIDVPTSTDLVMDDKIVLTPVVTKAVKTFITTANKLVFSTVAKVSTITSADLLVDKFAADDQIIIRGSTEAGPPIVNNDGVYTVLTSPAGSITVAEPVIDATADGHATIDEFDTFILHPTKRSEQLCTFIELGVTPTTLEVSFVPGGFWAASMKKSFPPLMQGLLEASKMYLVQVETAKYLQDEEEELIPDSNGGQVMKKETMLMRLFPVAGEALTVAVGVGFIQLH